LRGDPTTYVRRLGRFSATVVVVGGAIALAPTQSFAQSVDGVGFGDWDFSRRTVAGLYRFRRRIWAQDTGAARGAPSGAELPVTGYLSTSVRLVAVALFVVASLGAADWWNGAIGTAFPWLGIPVYLWGSRPTRASVGSGEGGTR
jgi:hypothetical protein